MCLHGQKLESASTTLVEYSDKQHMSLMKLLLNKELLVKQCTQTIFSAAPAKKEKNTVSSTNGASENNLAGLSTAFALNCVSARILQAVSAFKW